MVAGHDNWLDREISRLEARLSRVREDAEAAAWAARVAEVWADQYPRQVFETTPARYPRASQAVRAAAEVIDGTARQRDAEQREISQLLQALKAEASKFKGN